MWERLLSHSRFKRSFLTGANGVGESMSMILARRCRKGIKEIRRNVDVEAGNTRLSSATVTRPVHLVPGIYMEEFLSKFLSPKRFCHMHSIRKIIYYSFHGSQYLIFHESQEK